MHWISFIIETQLLSKATIQNLLKFQQSVREGLSFLIYIIILLITFSNQTWVTPQQNFFTLVSFKTYLVDTSPDTFFLYWLVHKCLPFFTSWKYFYFNFLNQFSNSTSYKMEFWWITYVYYPHFTTSISQYIVEDLQNFIISLLPSCFPHQP